MIDRDTAPSAAHEASTEARKIVANYELVALNLDTLGAGELGDAERLLLDFIAGLESELASLRSALATAQKLNEPESPDEENAFQDMGGWPAIDALRAENVALRSSLAEATEALEARDTIGAFERMLDALPDPDGRPIPTERAAENEGDPFRVGASCTLPGCSGVFETRKDDLGCDFIACSNYGATCDEAVYTYEQSMANTRAYAAANPEWRARFVAERGREPGVGRELGPDDQQNAGADVLPTFENHASTGRDDNADQAASSAIMAVASHPSVENRDSEASATVSAITAPAGVLSNDPPEAVEGTKATQQEERR